MDNYDDTFELQLNKDPVEIEAVKFSGDKLNEAMKNIPQFLPKKNFSFYIVGRPKQGKSCLINALICNAGRKIKGLNKHKSKFYYQVFERIFIFSPSIKTCENPPNIPSHRIFPEFDAELLEALLELLSTEQNRNSLFVFDDVIKALNNNSGDNARVLHKLLLNRRHVTFNPNDEDSENISGCSSIITSQRYNQLPLYIRASGISHLILFKVINLKDLKDIHTENCGEMSFEKFKKIAEFAWDGDHSFLYIILENDIHTKYYKNFDRILITEDYLE